MEGVTWELPPGVQRSKQAYLRDLPDLLADPRYRRQWVAYHGEERIAHAPTETALYQECRQRGLRDDEFYIGMVVPPLAEPETMDPSGEEYTEQPT
jgi:hypothetical protein